MTNPGDSFVVEDFLRATKGDVALWTTASVIVIAGLVGGYWAYSNYAPVQEAAGPPAGAMVVEFAEFTVSPVTEELDIAEADLSAASEATPPSEVEPEPEAEPIEEAEPVVEPEDAVEPEEVVEPEKVVETVEVETPPEEIVEPEPEPPVEPLPEPTPEPAPLSEPVEPIIDVPEIEVPEPAVVVPRRMAAVFPPLPEPDPVVEPVDPNLPVPVAMPQRIAEVRAETPPTVFKPPVQRAPPPQQQASQAAAPKPAAQQAPQAAAPQQVPSAEPSASQIESWQSSLVRHVGQRRKYPNAAVRRREEGIVWVQITIDTAGNVKSVSVSRSSGFGSLDQAALDVVQASSPLPRPPEGMQKSRLTINMPIEYDYERRR